MVLVHGGFVDGSGWEGVYNILRKHGYPVSIESHDLAGGGRRHDPARHRQGARIRRSRRTLLRRRVITEAGNDPKVAGLVSITAFAPDQGESVSTLIKEAPPGAPVPPILPP